MPVRDVGELAPKSAAAVSAYLDAVLAALCGVEPSLADDTIEDLSSHLLGELDPDSTPDDVAALVGELGAPDEYGEALCRELRTEAPRREPTPQGTVLGMPYDVRMPTAGRVAERWWNPADERLFLPRLFGIGWDLNFGALAVRLHLVRPDDEDEPFAQVPDAWFLGLLLVPVLITVAMGVSFALMASGLPEQLPVHWGITGQPDRFAPQASAFGFLFVMALVPTTWATWSVLAHRTPLGRGASIALGCLMATLAGGLWLLTLSSAMYDFSPWWAVLVLLGIAFGATLAVLVVLARVGRAAEIRRDVAARRESE